MQNDYEIVVVGAGVAGLNIAYQLALKNYSVCLVERSPHDFPMPTNAPSAFLSMESASWASLGIVSAKGRQFAGHFFTRVQLILQHWLNNKPLSQADDQNLAKLWSQYLKPELLHLMREHWQANGLLQISDDPIKAEKLARLCQYEMKQGSSMRPFEKQALQELYQDFLVLGLGNLGLTADAQKDFALFYPEDGQIRILNYLPALQKKVLAAGVEYKGACELKNIQFEAGEFKLDLEYAEHAADFSNPNQTALKKNLRSKWLILAAGDQTPQILKSWGLKAPPQTTRPGESFHMSPKTMVEPKKPPAEKIFQPVISHEQINIALQKDFKPLTNPTEAELSIAFKSFEASNRYALSPSRLARWGTINAHGHRARSLDRFPLISPHPQLKNLLIAAQFYKSGYAFAPFAAAFISAYIENGIILNPNVLWHAQRARFLNHLAEFGGHGWGQKIYLADQACFMKDVDF